MTESSLSLQERYAPKNRCFGCGPANDKGLRIRSFVEGDEVVCRWTPEPHHIAFGAVLNGGICGALLDCHLNWTAAHHLMLETDESQPPCTVTAEYSVKLRRPTPLDQELTIRGRVVESEGDRAWVEGSIEVDGVTTVTGSGLFVAVKEGHPAFHRW